MNQTTVVDVIPIDLFTIERSTLEPSTWLVWGHGPDASFDGGGSHDFVQLFDSYDTLDEAEEAYPDAVTITADDYDWPSDTIPQ